MGASPPDIDPSALFASLALSGRRRVVVAASGGGDSLALLILFRRFLDAGGSPIEPMAVTVDHRLRPESADEARQVGRIAAGLGISHRTLEWGGAKPAAGVSAAAREARHHLLAQAAREAGTDIVLTGHTLDDQAETLAMRLARGGGRGEAGMAPATLFDWRCWFARPLLGTRRVALRHFLSGLGQAWIDDPSNANMASERARMRAELTEAQILHLAAEAQVAGQHRADLGARAAALIAAHARMAAPGLVRLDRQVAAEPDRAAAVYALRILLACTGGREHLPDEARALVLLDRMNGVNFRATLSRSVIDARRDAVFLLRERRGLPQPRPAMPGFWDGRYRLEGGEESMTVMAAGDAGSEEVEAPADMPQSLAKAAASARPAAGLEGGGRAFLDTADGHCGIRARPVVAPWARYLPLFDIVPAAAAASLFGAGPVPAAPFAGHNGRRA
jgi:tRNA(Ile)-lysidine synthase